MLLEWSVETSARVLRVFVGASFVVLALACAATSYVVATSSLSTYDVAGGLIVAAVAFPISIVLFRKTARRDGDDTLFSIFTVGFVIKILAACAYYMIVQGAYGGAGDFVLYDSVGREVSGHLWRGDISEALLTALSARVETTTLNITSLTGTNFIAFFTGLIYAVIGPSLLGGFFVYAWLSTLGSLLFYRAFRLSVPQGDRRLFAGLLFFLPSLVFWPASLGKEAWMVFTLGIAALGGAKLFNGRIMAGAALLGSGLFLTALVRIHMSALFGLAVAFGIIVHRPSPRWGELRPVIKGLSLAAIGLAAVALLYGSMAFLATRGVDVSDGLGGAMRSLAARTSTGESGYGGSVPTSPTEIPVAAWSVLFRPHLLEADSVLAGVAALEGILLLGLAVAKRRAIARFVRDALVRGYAALILVYGASFVIAYSSLGNLGILVRQRAQLWPVLLMGLCWTAKEVTTAHPGEEQAPADTPRASVSPHARGQSSPL